MTSSAKSSAIVWITLGRSLTDNKNRSGGITDPCGTPVLIFVSCEFASFIPGGVECSKDNSDASDGGRQVTEFNNRCATIYLSEDLLTEKGQRSPCDLTFLDDASSYCRPTKNVYNNREGVIFKEFPDRSCGL